MKEIAEIAAREHAGETTDESWLRGRILHGVECEDMIAALERHETDGAGRAVLALRAGFPFQAWAELTAPPSRPFGVWETPIWSSWQPT
ncbi:hypothetical protein ACFVXG_34645 [Kitasatospora sp. NPDC058162]|uniref:hypothetical protein n=1 Tax=Kitasatospora sp. NPDC058162 TaxID=3346362 RepID=UPI0036DE2BF0